MQIINVLSINKVKGDEIIIINNYTPQLKYNWKGTQRHLRYTAAATATDKRPAATVGDVMKKTKKCRVMKYSCLMDCYAPNWTVNDVVAFLYLSLPCDNL